MSVLSAVTLMPLAFALLVCFAPKTWVRPLSLILALFEFGLSLSILALFDKSTPLLQLSESFVWISEFGINYHLAIDGLSLWLVIMTTFLSPLVILASWTSINKGIKGFH